MQAASVQARRIRLRSRIHVSPGGPGEDDGARIGAAVVSNPSRIDEARTEQPHEGREQAAAVETADAGQSARVAHALRMQGTAGNRALTRLLEGGPRLGRLVASADEASFNPESIVHDLRRAIDQSDLRVYGMTTVGTGFGARQEPIYKRFISGPKVVKALEGLTAAQVERVRDLYHQQEGTTLDNDLFEGGQSHYPSDLTEDERSQIRALLGGSRADPQAPGGPKPETPEGRFEADAVVLHGLVQGDLKGPDLERVMALHRRPGPEIDRVDSWYARHYGKELGVVLFDKLEGLQHSRMYFLRNEDFVKADACAIEAKRRAIEEIDAARPTGIKADILAAAPGGSAQLASIEASRQSLVQGIDDIVEQNRREAVGDPANAGKSADAAVRERLRAILSVRAEDPARSLGDELNRTLGPVKGGAIASMADGNLVEAAARRMLDLETSKTISSDKIAVILRGLRTQAVHDMQARALNPNVSRADKERMIASPDAAIDVLAKSYTEEFVRVYDDIRGQARSWAQIVASADSENQPMLIALVRAGGRMLEVEELEFAIRRKNVDEIKAVLRRQPTKEKLDELVEQYEFANGGKGSLATALYGATGSADFAEIVEKRYSQGALLHGRDAAHAAESLDRPEKLNGIEEAQWIAQHGAKELWVTEKTSGAMGSLREIGDDPETQIIMNESAKQLKALLAEFEQNDPWGRPRPVILAEMRRVRATLTGDASAYEAENEALVAQLKTAVTFAVQVALALALPGVGAGFLGTMALNIGATVVTNMAIQGEDYSLTSFRNDILGGVLGGLGGKLGEEAVGAIASQLTKSTASATVQAAERAGVGAAALAREAGTATVTAAEQSILLGLVKEGGNLIGSTAGTTVATGESGFTYEGLLQGAFMNLVGKFAPGAKHAGAGAPKEGGASPTTEGGTAHSETTEPTRTTGDEALPAGAPRPEHASSGEPPRAGAGEPAQPVDTTAPGSRAPKEPAGAAGAGGATRRGTTSERLEARRIVNSLEQLGSHWPDMQVHERLTSLTEIGNQVLRARGVPHVEFTEGAVGAGNGAHFDFETWKVVVDPGYVMRGSLPPEIVAFMSGLGRHELDHTLQWWAMARLQASKGLTGPEIKAAMHIPDEIAQHAEDMTKHNGPMSKAEQAAAQVWWDSVYGGNRPTREYNLGQREHYQERLAELDRQIRDAGQNADPAMVAERAQVAQIVKGFEAIYRGLPEEVPAYEQSGIVETEARLLEAERQLDLAEIALQHAQETLREVENELFSRLTSDAPPDPRRTAEHDRELARVKHLEERRDMARSDRDAAEQAATAGPAGSVAAPGGAPATPVAVPDGLAPPTGPPSPAGGPPAPVDPWAAVAPRLDADVIAELRTHGANPEAVGRLLDSRAHQAEIGALAMNHGAQGVRTADALVTSGSSFEQAKRTVVRASEVPAWPEGPGAPPGPMTDLVERLATTGRLQNPGTLPAFMDRIVYELVPNDAGVIRGGAVHELAIALEYAEAGQNVYLDARGADVVAAAAGGGGGGAALQVKEVSSPSEQTATANVEKAIGQLGGEGGEWPPGHDPSIPRAPGEVPYDRVVEIHFRGETADRWPPAETGDPRNPAPFRLHYADREMLLEWLRRAAAGRATFDEIRVRNHEGNFVFTRAEVLP